MSAREDVLDRIRIAVGPDPVIPEIPRDYVVASTLDRAERVERFAQRAAEYRATVWRCTVDDIAAAVGAALAEHGARRLVAPAGLPEAWRPDGVEWLVDGDAPLAVDVLDGADGVVTGCALAIADTGTIVLDAGPASGRRALTLVPDLHVCMVRADQSVGSVPEAIAALANAARERRPITLVSGPSATSDIELQRVEGVHGPRRLDVVVLAPTS